MSEPFDLPAFSESPKDIFFVPGVDTGLYPLANPGSAWRSTSRPQTHRFGIANEGRVNRRLRTDQNTIAEERQFSSCVEYASVLAVAKNLTVKDTCLAIDGKWLLSGPAGSRLLAKSFKAWRQSGKDKEEWADEFEAHFNVHHSNERSFTLYPENIAGLDCVTEANHLHNYFHCTVELFPALAVLAREPLFTGRVKVVCEKSGPPDFALRFIEDVFPNLAARVDFIKAPQAYEKVLIIWHREFDYFYEKNARQSELIGDRPQVWAGLLGQSLSKILWLNGHLAAIRVLRETALARASTIPGELPKQFWVGRKASKNPDRSVKNETDILKKLQGHGFDVVHFEDLSPLQQIKIMSQSKVMVSYHGAGFANMLYAGPDTQIIELGTLQTALQRWKDFLGLAFTSKATYSVIIADFEHDGDHTIPPMRGHGLYPVRLDGVAFERFFEILNGQIS